MTWPFEGGLTSNPQGFPGSIWEIIPSLRWWLLNGEWNIKYHQKLSFEKFQRDSSKRKLVTIRSYSVELSQCRSGGQEDRRTGAGPENNWGYGGECEAVSQATGGARRPVLSYSNKASVILDEFDWSQTRWLIISAWRVASFITSLCHYQKLLKGRAQYDCKKLMTRA